MPGEDRGTSKKQALKWAYFTGSLRRSMQPTLVSPQRLPIRFLGLAQKATRVGWHIC